jgi:type IV pilus assembly protein PilM
MAKNPSTVIGIDLGRYALKAVLMQRKGGNRFVLHAYAMRELARELDTPEKLAAELRSLIGSLNGSAKGCGVAVSGAEGIVRIIEQPPTPREIMRDALRLNGFALLSQDVREMVVDCDLIEGSSTNDLSTGEGSKVRFLVGGLARKRVDELGGVFSEIKMGLNSIQLSPVAIFNAFEFAQEQSFSKEAFMLVDIGHFSSTVTVGVKRSMVLVRSIDYGGNALREALMAAGAPTPQAAIQALETGDDVMIDAARISLTSLTREISSSIGFFEGRCEDNIQRVYVSGGTAQSRSIIQILAEELHLPCMAWNPFERCEIALSEANRASLRTDVVNLHVACGVAVEILKGS